MYTGREEVVSSPKRPIRSTVMSVVDSEISVEAPQSPKRPRTEGLEEGFENKDQETERPEKDFKMAVAEESDDDDDDDDDVDDDDDDDDEEVEADKDYTPEDLERDSKNFCCRLCKKFGHFAANCPWTYLCPSDVEIPPSHERICRCCGDIVDRAHPGVPYDDIPFRAESKRYYKVPEFVRPAQAN